MRSLALACAIVCLPLTALAATLQVGPGRTYTTPCAAIAAAQAGDRIEIDAATYLGDVCGWSTNGLTLVGVGGRPVIDAAGQNAQGKGIWVISGDDTLVENVEFTGAAVPDMNGAGIRQQGRNLTVRGCYFHHNQDGILAGDATGSTITIERTEFAYNGAGDGQSHNLYINHVDTLMFGDNYSHHAIVGHLLKSRARTNIIAYNRFSDEQDGEASYEINLPSAGTSYILGNVVEQGPATQNSAIIDYGSETGTLNAGTDLYVVNNTVVNDRPNGGTFVQINAAIPTPAKLLNNIFFGPGTVTNQDTAVQAANYTGPSPKFVNAAAYDYRLADGSPCIDAAQDPGMAGSVSLAPVFHYVHPLGSEARVTVGALDIGAYEFGAGMPVTDGGSVAADAGDTTDAGGVVVDGGTSPDGGPGGDGPAVSGCGCAAESGAMPVTAALICGAAALVLFRARRRERG